MKTKSTCARCGEQAVNKRRIDRHNIAKVDDLFLRRMNMRASYVELLLELTILLEQEWYFYMIVTQLNYLNKLGLPDGWVSGLW